MDGLKPKALSWKVAALLLVLVGLGGCARAGASPQSPDKRVGVTETTEASSDAPGAGQAALPRYFSLELAGAAARVGGEEVAGLALSRLIKTEAADPRNDGVAIRLGAEFSGEALGALVWELSTAGFAHIVISQGKGLVSPAQPAEPEDSINAVQPAPAVAEPPETEPQATAASEPEPETETAVVVKNIGLHVGGGPNDEQTKAFYAGPIEEHFVHFRRCHRLAVQQDLRASVGVDLLVGRRGGAPTVKDFRTVLKGKSFRRCVRKVFSRVRFATPPRPTVISYSLLFKPQG